VFFFEYEKNEQVQKLGNPKYNSHNPLELSRNAVLYVALNTRVTRAVFCIKPALSVYPITKHCLE